MLFFGESAEEKARKATLAEVEKIDLIDLLAICRGRAQKGWSAVKCGSVKGSARYWNGVQKTCNDAIRMVRLARGEDTLED